MESISPVRGVPLLTKKKRGPELFSAWPRKEFTYLERKTTRRDPQNLGFVNRNKPNAKPLASKVASSEVIDKTVGGRNMPLQHTCHNGMAGGPRAVESSGQWYFADSPEYWRALWFGPECTSLNVSGFRVS